MTTPTTDASPHHAWRQVIHALLGTLITCDERVSGPVASRFAGIAVAQADRSGLIPMVAGTAAVLVVAAAVTWERTRAHT